MKIVAFVALGLLLVLLVALIISKRSPPPQISFQGRPVPICALDLNSASALTRENAAQAIRQFGTNAVPNLVQLLQARDPILARPFETIGGRAPYWIRRMLFRVLDPTAAPAKRMAAAQALRIMGQSAQAALPALRQALQDEQTVAWHAALALAELGEPGIVALTQGLAETQPAQRGMVCYALETQGRSASNAVPALVRVLEKAPAETAKKAAAALAAVGPAAVPALLNSISHPSLGVRVQAIDALASMGPIARDSLPKLIGVAVHDEPAARAAAVRALVQIRPGAEEISRVLLRALRDPVDAVRLEALQCLSRSNLAPERVAPELLLFMRDRSPEIRRQTVSLLGQTVGTGPETIEALTIGLLDADDLVQIMACEALTRLRPGQFDPAK